MAEENEISGVVTIGVDLAPLEAGLAEAPPLAASAMRELVSGIESVGRDIEAAGLAAGRSLGQGVLAGVRQLAAQITPEIQQLVAAATQIASTPAPRGRLPASGQLYGQQVSGTSGNYSIAGDEAQYKRIADVTAAAQARALQPLIGQLSQVIRTVAEVHAVATAPPLRRLPASGEVFGQNAYGSSGNYVLGRPDGRDRVGDDGTQFKRINDLDIAARQARIQAIRDETQLTVQLNQGLRAMLSTSGTSMQAQMQRDAARYESINPSPRPQPAPAPAAPQRPLPATQKSYVAEPIPDERPIEFEPPRPKAKVIDAERTGPASVGDQVRDAFEAAGFGGVQSMRHMSRELDDLFKDGAPTGPNASTAVQRLRATAGVADEVRAGEFGAPQEASTPGAMDKLGQLADQLRALGTQLLDAGEPKLSRRALPPADSGQDINAAADRPSFQGGAQLRGAPGYPAQSPLFRGPGPIWQDRIEVMGEEWGKPKRALPSTPPPPPVDEPRIFGTRPSSGIVEDHLRGALPEMESLLQRAHGNGFRPNQLDAIPDLLNSGVTSGAELRSHINGLASIAEKTSVTRGTPDVQRELQDLAQALRMLTGEIKRDEQELKARTSRPQEPWDPSSGKPPPMPDLEDLHDFEVPNIPPPGGHAGPSDPLGDVGPGEMSQAELIAHLTGETEVQLGGIPRSGKLGRATRTGMRPQQIDNIYDLLGQGIDSGPEMRRNLSGLATTSETMAGKVGDPQSADALNELAGMLRGLVRGIKEAEQAEAGHTRTVKDDTAAQEQQTRARGGRRKYAEAGERPGGDDALNRERQARARGRSDGDDERYANMGGSTRGPSESESEARARQRRAQQAQRDAGRIFGDDPAAWGHEGGPGAAAGGSGGRSGFGSGRSGSGFGGFGGGGPGSGDEENQMGAPKDPSGRSRYGGRREAESGIRDRFLGNDLRAGGSGAMDHPGQSPLDYLFGGLANTAKYIQYFGALSGAIAIFGAITKAIHDATQEALAFNEASIELNTTLGGSKANAAGAAQSFGDIATQAGLAPSTGVQTGAIGIRRMGAQQGDAKGVGDEFTKQSSMLSVLDPTSKPTDYANSLGSIAQTYGLAASQIGQVTNLAYVGFEKFGGSISETIKGVEQLAPVAKQAHVPLAALVETVSDINARTNKSGDTIAGDLTKALQGMGSTQVQHALEVAGVRPSGNGYQDLQALAEKFPTLGGRQAQVLHDIGGKSGSIGVMLQDWNKIQGAGGDAANDPQAAQKAFEDRMKSVREVVAQVGAEFLNLGKDFANSGILASVGLLLESLKPILGALDQIVRVFDVLGEHGPFKSVGHDVEQWVVGLGSAYALLRLVSRTTLGSTLAGVPATTNPGNMAMMGGVARSVNSVAGPGLVGAGGWWSTYQARRNFTPVDYGAPLEGPRGGPLAEQSRPGQVNGPMYGPAGPPPGKEPRMPGYGRIGFNTIAGAAGLGAGFYGALSGQDPVSSGLSAGVGAALLAPAGMAGPAGLAVGGLVIALGELRAGAKATADAVRSHTDAEKAYAEFSTQRPTLDGAKSMIDTLTADRDKQHTMSHPSNVQHWSNNPFGTHRRGNDPKEKAARAKEDQDNADIAHLQAMVDDQNNTAGDLQYGRSDNYAGVFGTGDFAFGMQGSGQQGLQALQQLGFGGEGRAAVWRQAVDGTDPAKMNPGSLGEIVSNSLSVAQGEGTAVTARTGIGVTGAQAALASAQADMAKLQASNATPEQIAGEQETIQNLTNALDSAFNSRIKAVQALASSFRAQDDVFGKHDDVITSLQTQLTRDTAAHGAGSDQAIADQTALNQELQSQIQDTAAATAAQFEAGVDPRNPVEGAAAQVQIATRNLQNSTAGSAAFFQAQGALLKSQVAYGQAVAEAQAQNVMLGAAAHPLDQRLQLQAGIQANNIRIAALKAPLPKLADPSQAKGLALDQAAAVSQDPQVNGANAAVKFVTGVTSVNYKAVGAGIAADLKTGLVGGQGGGDGSNPLGSGGGASGDVWRQNMGKWLGTVGVTLPGVDPTTGIWSSTGGQDVSNDGGDSIAAATNPSGVAPNSALGRAGTPIPGYDANTAAAIKAGEDAATVALAIDNLNKAAQQRQMDEQAKQATNTLGVAQAGGGAASTAYGALLNANSQMAFLKREEPNYKTDPQYIAAQTAAVQATQQLTAALRENTKNVALLGGDMTNPIFMAQQTTADAERKLADDTKAGYHDDVLNPDRLAVQQSKNAQQATTFDTNLQLAQTNYQLGTDARFAGEQGRMGLSAYLKYLNGLRANLLAVKNKTFEQQRELNEVDQAIQSTTSQFSGQFNLGDIKVPTIYEARRSVAATNAGQSYSDNRTVQIQINGGNTAHVVQVLKAQLGTPALATVSTGKKVI